MGPWLTIHSKVVIMDTNFTKFVYVKGNGINYNKITYHKEHALNNLCFKSGNYT